MYIPASFAETDRNKLFDFIEQYGFATLVSTAGTEPIASRLPFLLDRQAGPQGRLVGHMARANPQWKSADGSRVLVMFDGPHAYISPTWYESQQVVPTWNYVAVHAYGTLHVDEDPGRVLGRVRELVNVYESGRATPWTIESQDNEFVEQMIKGIVGFDIELDRIEGKWKLNQNHPSDRRLKVIRALRQQEGQDAQAIADMMAEREKTE